VQQGIEPKLEDVAAWDLGERLTHQSGSKARQKQASQMCALVYEQVKRCVDGGRRLGEKGLTEELERLTVAWERLARMAEAMGGQAIGVTTARIASKARESAREWVEREVGVLEGEERLKKLRELAGRSKEPEGRAGPGRPTKEDGMAREARRQLEERAKEEVAAARRGHDDG
jgi:hypothetical protein